MWRDSWAMSHNAFGVAQVGKVSVRAAPRSRIQRLWISIGFEFRRCALDPRLAGGEDEVAAPR